MREDRVRLIEERGVTVVLDVGANAGQYASRLRKDGYMGTIVSFEPLRDAFERLRAAAADDPAWHTLNIALGEAPAVATMNVSANSYSSSFLPIATATVDAAPDAAYIGVEDVSVTALDLLTLPDGRKMLKADVQGAEPLVLRGARALLPTVELVELEMSLVPIYEGQVLAPAVCAMMRERGFAPVALEASFTHPDTGEILQIDGIFANVSR
ncbi:MAG: FkbM family methyltransferase [Actinobacteria bacterium]|nr:FkbM family methyltransferase [Actinomycetota bacterium]